jgi:DNA repair protein RAD16
MVRRSARLQQKAEEKKLQDTQNAELEVLTPPDSNVKSVTVSKPAQNATTPSRNLRRSGSNTKVFNSEPSSSITPKEEDLTVQVLSSDTELINFEYDSDFTTTPSRVLRSASSNTKEIAFNSEPSSSIASKKRNLTAPSSDPELSSLTDDSDFTPTSSPAAYKKSKVYKPTIKETGSQSNQAKKSLNTRNSAKKGKSSRFVSSTANNSDSEYEYESPIEEPQDSIGSDEDVFDQHTSTESTLASSTPPKRAQRSATQTRRNRTKRTSKPKLSAKERVRLIHPELDEIWTNLANEPVIPTESIEQPADLKLPLLPFQKEGVNWMIKQEKTFFGGGILADEMGMGKTIQMIGLLLSEPRIKPNLIVAPTVALIQWNNEITAHTSTISTYLFHGSKRTDDIEELMKYDVVLTTYNIIENSFRKQTYGNKRNGKMIKTPSIIHKIKWGRLILDEAHYIKDRSCNTARAAFNIPAEYKWSLSGTPLQNRVGELYSQIRLLKADPFSYYFCKKCPCKSLNWKFHNNSECEQCGHKPMSHFCWWNAEVLRPIQNFGNKGEGKIGYEKLGKLLDRVMLRRTKVERAKDLGLPPRVLKIRKDVFNEEEEDMYESLYTSTKRKFTTYVQEGTVLNNYANIFELITKMRLAANHPDLILKRVPPKESGKEALTEMPTTMICSICHDEAEDAIMAKCKHIFCREDIRQYIETSIERIPKCPACFAAITIDLAQPTINQQSEEKQLIEGEKYLNKKESGQDFRTSIVNRIDMSTWRSSTKIEALVEELHKLRSQNHTIKSIVFSQFVNFLDLINWRLHRAGFACCRLDGRMQPAQRDAVIRT